MTRICHSQGLYCPSGRHWIHSELGCSPACCNGTQPPHLNAPSLSSDGRDAAVFYGQKILCECQLSDDLAHLAEENDTGLTYVGDRVVVHTSPLWRMEKNMRCLLDQTTNETQTPTRSWVVSVHGWYAGRSFLFLSFVISSYVCGLDSTHLRVCEYLWQRTMRNSMEI